MPRVVDVTFATTLCVVAFGLTAASDLLPPDVELSDQALADRSL